MSATSKSVKQESVQTETPRQESAPQPPRQEVTKSVPQPPATSTSEAALEKRLSEWGGRGGTQFSFNGSTGVYHTIDGTEVPVGTTFVAHLHETYKGYIHFNGTGVQPDVRMVRIDSPEPEVTRDELGELDRSLWQIGLNNELEDPWKEQFCALFVKHDQSAEPFAFTARGPVAMNAFRDLLGKWRFHPNRKAGFIPVVRIESGMYFNRKVKRDMPKPILKIDGWVTPSGEPAPALVKLSLRAELDDDLPDFTK